jgi:pyridoxamine 5'-phosphate oxidase
MTDHELLRRFEAADLADFPHVAHVRVAWAALERDGEPRALDTMVAALKRFTAAKGAPEKFHHTLTRAWLTLVADARARMPGTTQAAALLDAYPALANPRAIDRHYSSERLASEEARQGWVEPNRAALTVAADAPADEPIPDSDPFAQFAIAVANAQKHGVDTTPVALATADAQGHPSVRMVLLRGADARGFVFHTNYNSRKARELTENAHAALCLHWPTLEEQIRIEGTVGRLPADESDAYFAGRPRGSQIGAWASDQSALLPAREIFEQRLRDVEARFDGQPVLRPPFWGGFRIVPHHIEFWYGRVSRLHDRVVYVREGDTWRTERLYP